MEVAYESKNRTIVMRSAVNNNTVVMVQDNNTGEALAIKIPNYRFYEMVKKICDIDKRSGQLKDRELEIIEKIGIPSDIDKNIWIKTISEFFDMPPETLLNSKNHRRLLVSRPRRYLMFFLRMGCSLSYPHIGLMFNGMNHATAILACRRVIKDYESKAEERVLTDNIIRQTTIESLRTKSQEMERTNGG